MKNIKRKLAILLFALCLIVSLIFYANKGYGILGYILLVIENTMKTFLGNSPLKLSDILDLKVSNTNTVNSLFILIYALIIYMAPIFLAAAVVTEFKNFNIKIYKLIFNIKIKYSKDDIIVFGYNDLVKLFLDNKVEEKKKRNIIVVSNENINEDQTLRYLKNSISFINTNLSNNSNKEKDSIYSFVDKAESIYLFEKDDLINYSYLIEICTHYENVKEYNANAKKIYCYAEDYQANVMISKFIHSKLSKDEDEEKGKETREDNNDKKNNLNKVISDYNVFDISSLRIRKLLSNPQVNIISDYKKPNTHSIIIGFGNIGHTIFNEILNKSVYNQNGKIRFDIISKDIENEKNYILNRTSGYYFKPTDRTQNHLEISSNPSNNDFRCDGNLDVYFHKDSIEDKSFYRKMKEILNESEGGVDNIFICTSDVSTTIRAMNSLQDLHTKNEELFKNIVNIYIRMENNNIFSNYYFNNDKSFKYIVIPSAKEVLNTKSIENIEETNKAIAYNYIYNQLCDSVYNITKNDNNTSFIDLDVIKKLKNEFENNSLNSNDKVHKKDYEKNVHSNLIKAKTDWQKLDFASRESTWGLVLHQKVKDDLLNEVYNKESIREDVNNVSKIRFDGLSSLIKYLNESSNTPMFDFIKIEHRRWCYMKALEGFHYVENGNKKKQQQECLLTYDKLVERVPKKVLYDLIPLIYEFC